jgi:hypothetical protein
MKKIVLLAVAVAIIALGYAVSDQDSVLAANPAKASAKAAKSSTPISCQTCHADFSSLIPENHPPVKGNELSACTACHAPELTGTIDKNAYSVRMHLAHLPPKGNVDCLVCHRWQEGKSFGLTGAKESWGAPNKEEMELMKEIFTGWAASVYMDNLHAKAGISCANCHGKELPTFDVTVENTRCLACHGPMEALVKKTEPPEFKDRNPHQSHLGDIACTVCHKAHSESKVYCLGCHQNFKMTIQGAGETKP